MSERRFFKHQIAIAGPGHNPTRLAIKPLRARSPRRCQPATRTVGRAEYRAGTFEQSSRDAAPLIGLSHEQRPDGAIPRIGGGKSNDLAILLPHENAAVIDEPV